ncbi:uncharacterized protein LOC115765758 [Drosophila novamexicana]|uniref:uncharacterized protein LOC115765758 n=1 Tax=Drosophila novamexicana TaxID=47314 RepID=UPI0011E5A013|nr:uncharacterized protein LOC115765758 [Drosophila novamexicana]
MRPVLFQFYTVETILNMLIMFYHIRGFLAHPLDFLEFRQQFTHYFFSVSFYIFTILTLFASINICTGHQCSLSEEIIRTVCGFVFYITISLLTLEDAESDFHLMYLMVEHESEVERPLHPFFEFMRAQALCALTCGVTYLLHAIVVIDVSLSNEEDSDFERMVDDSDEYSENVEYIPARLYLLGGLVQTHLEQYEWFYNFARGAPLPI